VADDTEFVVDLGAASEAWFSYSEQMFGPVTWMTRPDGRRQQVNSPERNAAWDAYLHAFMHARGCAQRRSFLAPRSSSALGTLDPSRRTLVANALRFAADQYARDAEITRVGMGASDRVSAKFEQQANDCREIAEAIEP
jgi:hypothetical protein